MILRKDLQYRQPVNFLIMKSINEQINPKFVIQAKILHQFAQLLQNVLPYECRNHVQVANIRQNILMLITDSPVWTTRLRQLSPQILHYIHDNSSKFDDCVKACSSGKSHIIHHIQISTRYHATNAYEHSLHSNKQRSAPSISNKTAELLTQSANSIDHPKLKTALLKIASHGGANTNGAFSSKQPDTEK